MFFRLRGTCVNQTLFPDRKKPLQTEYFCGPWQTGSSALFI